MMKREGFFPCLKTKNRVILLPKKVFFYFEYTEGYRAAISRI